MENISGVIYPYYRTGFVSNLHGLYFGGRKPGGKKTPAKNRSPMPAALGGAGKQSAREKDETIRPFPGLTSSSDDESH